jgi:hypothetical protein
VDELTTAHHLRLVRTWGDGETFLVASSVAPHPTLKG